MQFGLFSDVEIGVKIKITVRCPHCEADTEQTFESAKFEGDTVWMREPICLLCGDHISREVVDLFLKVA